MRNRRLREYRSKIVPLASIVLKTYNNRFPTGYHRIPFFLEKKYPIPQVQPGYFSSIANMETSKCEDTEDESILEVSEFDWATYLDNCNNVEASPESAFCTSS